MRTVFLCRASMHRELYCRSQKIEQGGAVGLNFCTFSAISANGHLHWYELQNRIRSKKLGDDSEKRFNLQQDGTHTVRDGDG